MTLLRSVATAAAFVAATLALSPAPSLGQSGDAKSTEQQRQQARQPVDPAKERKRRLMEITEAAKALTGPAGNAECVWVGRRVISLLWRDDLDTALRHLDLYDRFGCPGGHIQAAFRCLIRMGDIDPKVPESLQSRVHACWVNPSHEAATPAAAAAPASPDKR